MTVRRAMAGWPALRELIGEQPGPRTSLDKVIGPRRTLALVRCNFDLIANVAHANGATVNDMLLTMTAGGLRAPLRSRGEPADNLVVPIYVPVSLRRDRSQLADGNLISQMVVPLPIATADPETRIQQIAMETARRKAVVRPSLGTLFRSRIVATFLLKHVARQRVNVETADLPGPAVPLSLCGARVTEVFPLLNPVGNISLGVGALSYGGLFNLMVVGDADNYSDIDIFAAGVRDELSVLAGQVMPAVEPR